MHKFLWLRNALIVILVSGACGGAPQGGSGERVPTRTGYLWLPDGAIIESEPDMPTARDHSIAFRISVPQAEEMTTQLIDHFAHGGWHARYATPLAAASFKNGWRRTGGIVLAPPQDVREWAGDWENQAGDRVEYRLLSIRFEARSLTEIHGSGRWISSPGLWNRMLQMLH